jgi:hypothetical protein
MDPSLNNPDMPTDGVAARIALRPKASAAARMCAAAATGSRSTRAIPIAAA